MAEIAIREIHVDSAVGDVCKAREIHIVWPVEEIEDFKPDLEIDPFRNVRVLVEVDIGLDKVRPAELHSLLIPIRTAVRESGNGKVGLRNASREPRAVRMGLAIAARIRVSEIIPVT